MNKRIKKSIETEHKINLHCHFTMSEYLALYTNDNYDIINFSSLSINKQSLVSFIDDYLIKKYTQVIDSKIALAYGVDKSYSYFDLFEYVLNVNKLVHHSKIYSIKESGFREFYYALKNFNEVSSYKEGILFELVYKVHKGLIKYNELYNTIQDIIHQEAQFREDEKFLLRTMTIPDITPDELSVAIKESRIIKVPDLNVIYNDHLNYLNDSIKQRSSQSSSILHAQSKLKSTILGYREKQGFFGKETYLVEKDPFRALIHGSRHMSEHIIHNYMYQSLFNKKGFIYINFGATGVDKYIRSFAYTFNVLDEVVYVPYGSKEFHELDLNAMIRNNKIVIIQIPNTERVPEQLVVDGYKAFDELISTITIDSSGDYPYTIFLDNTYRFPDSFCDSLEKLADLKSLGYSSFVTVSYIDTDRESRLLSLVDHIFIFKSEDYGFLSDVCNAERLDIRDIRRMDDFQFYFFTNGITDRVMYKSLVFV